MTKKKTKLIWEFRGPNGQGIAEHHKIHLDEYCEQNNINNAETGLESYHNSIFIAFLILDETEHEAISDILKPHFKVPV